MTKADIPAVAAIEAACFGDAWPPAAFVEALDMGALCWSVEWDGALAGYLVAIVDSGAVHIANLAVGEDFRRRGLAKMMINKIIDCHSGGSVKKIRLEVRHSNTPAIGLYQSLGFLAAGIKMGYYSNGEDALIYVRRL